MAIRLIDRYPNRADPATPDYPHGKGRNKSDPTADDGTPFDEARFNDQEAFFQGLLEKAGITPSGVVDTVQQSDYLDALDQVFVLKSNKTVSIPSDYATLQEAIDAESRYRVKQGVTITINVESGHALTGGIYVENGDFSHFIVDSDDAAVLLDGSFPDESSVIEGFYAIMPRLHTVIDGDGTKGQHGYYANRGSRGYVAPNAGIKNIAGTGTFVDAGAGLFCNRGAVVVAREAVFTGCVRNVWVTGNSSADLFEATLTGATGDIAVYASRMSAVHMQGADVSDANNKAIVLRRSWGMADSATVDNAGEVAVVVERASMFSATIRDGVPATFNGSAEDGIIVSFGSQADFRESEIKNAVRDGVRIFDSAKCNLLGAVITGSGRQGVDARDDASASLNGATVTGSGTNDINIGRGGIVNAVGCTTSSGSPATGDTNVGSFNAISGSDGIIWG